MMSDMWRVILISLAFCATTMLAGGMYWPLPWTNATDDVRELNGVYQLCEEVSWCTGETLVLDNGQYSYWFYSDFISPVHVDYPVRGRFELQGSRLTLDSQEIHQPVRILESIKGTRVLWHEDGREYLQKTGVTPTASVLIYSGTYSRWLPFPPRPSARLLGVPLNSGPKARRPPDAATRQLPHDR